MNEIFIGTRIDKINIDDKIFNVRSVYDSKYIKEIICKPIFVKYITNYRLIELLKDTNHNVIFCDDSYPC